MAGAKKVFVALSEDEARAEARRHYGKDVALARDAFAAEGVEIRFTSSPHPKETALRVMDGTVDVDLWNYWHFIYTGAVIHAATGSLASGQRACERRPGHFGAGRRERVLRVRFDQPLGNFLPQQAHRNDFFIGRRR